jgi:hypothetical protein
MKGVSSKLLTTVAFLCIACFVSAADGINIVSMKLSAQAMAFEDHTYIDPDTFALLNELDYGQDSSDTGTFGTVTASAISGPLYMSVGSIDVSAFELNENSDGQTMMYINLPPLPNGDPVLEIISNFGDTVTGNAMTTFHPEGDTLSLNVSGEGATFYNAVSIGGSLVDLTTSTTLISFAIPINDGPYIEDKDFQVDPSDLYQLNLVGNESGGDAEIGNGTETVALSSTPTVPDTSSAGCLFSIALLVVGFVPYKRRSDSGWPTSAKVS